ncbi:unnamed protein product [Ilex paraguariensis]|uniref:Uncharacterized protein n=1 Tax=Ilex paraguariensis TaxID=185542 RepID=A0ABC8RR34_9AQUA
MVTNTIWKPKHSQKESHPLAAGNGKEIISNEVEPTTEMVMSKEKPPLDHGCSINSEIGVPVQLFIPTTSSNKFERLEIEGGNLVVDLDYAATSCDHNHGEARLPKDANMAAIVGNNRWSWPSTAGSPQLPFIMVSAALGLLPSLHCSLPQSLGTVHGFLVSLLLNAALIAACLLCYEEFILRA